uniref:Uncharacterized protein n=1 Tax=Acrobeloides nanus TaxID=290746 RepID=A0A914D7Z8_9BILA
MCGVLGYNQQVGREKIKLAITSSCSTYTCENVSTTLVCYCSSNASCRQSEISFFDAMRSKMNKWQQYVKNTFNTKHKVQLLQLPLSRKNGLFKSSSAPNLLKYGREEEQATPLKYPKYKRGLYSRII